MLELMREEIADVEIKVNELMSIAGDMSHKLVSNHLLKRLDVPKITKDLEALATGHGYEVTSSFYFQRKC